MRKVVSRRRRIGCRGELLARGLKSALLRALMPIATPAQYRAMLDAAQQGDYAYPAINVTSITTINGALKAFADSKSDGILQVSTGGGEFASGVAVKDMAFGAIVLAEGT